MLAHFNWIIYVNVSFLYKVLINEPFEVLK